MLTVWSQPDQWMAFQRWFQNQWCHLLLFMKQNLSQLRNLPTCNQSEQCFKGSNRVNILNIKSFLTSSKPNVPSNYLNHLAIQIHVPFWETVLLHQSIYTYISLEKNQWWDSGFIFLLKSTSTMNHPPHTHKGYILIYKT